MGDAAFPAPVERQQAYVVHVKPQPRAFLKVGPLQRTCVAATDPTMCGLKIKELNQPGGGNNPGESQLHSALIIPRQPHVAQLRRVPPMDAKK